MSDKSKNNGRSRVIQTIQTPLGFFTLVVLVLEVILGLLAAKASDFNFTILVISMVGLLTILVLIVTYFACKNPGVLIIGKSQTPIDKLKTSAEQIGLVDVISACQKFGLESEWGSLLTPAKEIVEILGYSMHATLNNKEFTERLGELVKNPNFQFRAILADPQSPLIRQRSYSLEEKLDYEMLAKYITNSRQTLSNIIATADGPIVDRREIRTFSDIIVPYSLIRVDNKMLIMPYMSSSGKKNSPVLVVEGKEKELFKKFEQDFMKVWRRAQPVHNPRVSVPKNYITISSEKDLIAQSVAQKLAITTEKCNCLDIGCGDGTQSILTFNEIKEKNPCKNIDVPSLIDPSTFAVQACEQSLISSKTLFTHQPPFQTMWQEYSPDTKFHFIFCCHVIGAIYQQSESDREFQKEFKRMIETLEPGGQICIVLAYARSIEIQLRQPRRHARIAPKKILSAERFADMLERWGVKYEMDNVNSFLKLEGWLGNSTEDVKEVEKEIINFLFSPPTELTREIANYYRKGLRNSESTKRWKDMEDQDKKRYLTGIYDRNRDINDDDLFVEMHHVCFWIKGE